MIVQVSRRRALEFADAVGLPERAAVLAIDRLAERSTAWFDRVDELPFDDRRLHDLRRFMVARHRLVTIGK